MQCNAPRFGELVGVGVTVTVTVVVVVMDSGDAVSTHEENNQQLSPEALATIIDMKENVKKWSSTDVYVSVYLVKWMMEKDEEKELCLVSQLLVMEEQ